MSKTALITGATGQDGAYLAELLLAKGYTVHGVKRRSSSFNTGRLDHLYEDPHEGAKVKFFLHHGDLTDSTNLIRIVQETQPDEIYNLAAQSHVAVSFETPEYTANADAVGTLRLLEAIRILKLEQKARFYQASTSEMFGLVQEKPQRETTPFYPRSPYGAAKVYGYWITVNYREAYGIHASNGILFNHESPIRGETFVTRKITRAVSAIHHGLQDTLYLGNMDSVRDWGHARDYVKGMWLMMQQPKGDDFVLATGETHTVREFVEKSFAHVGIAIEWKGKDESEQGLDAKTGRVLVKVDPRYYRPTEVDFLQGDASKANTILGWVPETSFSELVRDMMESDLLVMKQGRNSAYAYSLASKKVWVAGHKGMAGSAIVRRLASENCTVLTADRAELDLSRQEAVEDWLAVHKPQAIFLAAATVGGIMANSSRPAEFIRDNLVIETSVIHGAYKAGVEKLLFLGSSCIYPKLAPQPMKEEALLTGPLESSNEWYAVAKIAGIKMCQAYRRQYGCDFFAAMPTNLFGAGDNYDLQQGHVVAALIMKIDAAKREGRDTVELWGTGTPLREFLFADDMADGLVFLMKNYSGEPHVNVGSGIEMTIRELAERIATTVGWKGAFTFDTSKPDGTPRKVMDVSKLTAMGWTAKTPFDEALASAYRWYVENRGARYRAEPAW